MPAGPSDVIPGRLLLRGPCTQLRARARAQRTLHSGVDWSERGGTGTDYIYFVNMSVQLLGKRELKRLASVANDGAGTG